MDKVLIIASDFFNYQFSIEDAYKNLGFETRVIAYYGGAVKNFREKVAYHIAMDKQKHLEQKKRKYNERVLELYNEFRPDLVFMMQASDLYVETVEKMNGCKLKVLWMYDSIFRIKGGY